VDRITNDSLVTSAKLSGYQVFFANYISAWASSGQFPAAAQAAVQDFVETQGGGVFLINKSGDSPLPSQSPIPSQFWPWYYKVLQPCHYMGAAGGNTASTGWVGIYDSAAKANPIMEGITWGGVKPDSVVWQNMELDQFDKVITDPSIKPKNWQGLLGLNAATCSTPNTCGSSYNYNVPGGYPISWTYPVKSGAVGYFMEGHDLSTMVYMTRPMWDRFFTQFLYYIAGYDTILIPGAIVGGKFPDLSSGLDASGITFHPAEQAGVFISRPGSHEVSLIDMAGHKVKEIRGHSAPVDYDLSAELPDRSGIYVMRVRVAGIVRSQRVLIP
jgi:hypothetical protein